VVQVSAVAHTPGRGLERYLGLHGERGTLELDNLGGPFAVRAAGAGDAAFAELPLPADLGGPGDGRPALDQLLAWLRTAPVGARAFVDAIVAGRPVRPSFWDGWRAQEVLEAALRSSASGRWERVAPPPPTS
jgi:predicted dehydrogenase